MTQLSGDELAVPIQSAPQVVDDFFSYDMFDVLWYDIPMNSDFKFWKPETDGAFFGVRNLCGESSDGRKMTVNMAITAEESEMTSIRRIALAVLGDYPSFEKKITGCFYIDGSSYALKTDAFYGWINAAEKTQSVTRCVPAQSKVSSMLMRMKRAEEPLTESDLLRLAVYTSDRKDIRKITGDGLVWKMKHPCIVSSSEFYDLFSKQAPVWRLSSEND